ncbi:MAG: FKBP12-associated protein [Lichina confinis]|nr:MAG: FKBP12-associated protein [Lichina confinis]
MSNAESQTSISQRASRPRHRYRPGRPGHTGSDRQATGETAHPGRDEDVRGGESRGLPPSHRPPRRHLAAATPGPNSTGQPNATRAGTTSQSNDSRRRQHRPNGTQDGGRPPHVHGETSEGRFRNGAVTRHNGPQNRTTGRSFGGHLTSSTSTLDAGAPEFHPNKELLDNPFGVGPSSAVQAHKVAPTRTVRARQSSKSSAPDVITRIHEDIANKVYECPICTNEMGSYAKIWSCRTCWTVFHLSCVKRWAKNADSDARAGSDDDITRPVKVWRCPGCNLTKEVMPSNYSCWCEKELDPRPLPGLPPHSCGQTCGRPRIAPKQCPHPCELLCHAGPCPPCGRMGPAEPCFCGKETSVKKCIDTDYNKGWSCEQVCGDLMPCAEHTCDRTCHGGLCGSCPVRIQARCYCGKVEKMVECMERGPKRQSEQSSDDSPSGVEIWEGCFKCEVTCGRLLDCGKHRCIESCHPQQVERGHCPRSADVVTHCPCGKTPLSRILEHPRQSCEDVIPNCGEKCSKKMACGHECLRVCHVGECMPCLQSVSIACRCGRTQSRSRCHQGSPQVPQCRRVCKATLGCGRHECGERCCPGERKAVERQSTKRRQRPLDSMPLPRGGGIEAEHVCTRVCGRKLKCGNHVCDQLCHRGPCGSCREAIFEELPCHCGRTVLQPPLPCGTRPPPCEHSCDRPKLCGHPQVPHNCHGDDEECPKCPFLIERVCMCGKKTVKNQQCWRAEVGCGEKCEKLLRCGSHHCRKTCHRPGECEDVGKHCQQTCGKPRKTCLHPCDVSCHAPYACVEDRPCSYKILVTCACQHRKKETRCNAHRGSKGSQTEVLCCDEECGRLERNRKLAVALNIDQETHVDDHIPYSRATMDYYVSNTTWVHAQERALRDFAADENEKRVRFKPMPAHQRGFLHSLAEDFGLDSESLDPEPHRHVVLLKTPRFVTAPIKRLAQCADIRKGAVASAPAIVAEPHSRSEGAGATSIKTAAEPLYNAFLLSQPRFALTVEEVHGQLDSVLSSNPTFSFSVDFLPSDEVVLRAQRRHGGGGGPQSSSSERELENFLRSFHAPLTRAIANQPNSIARSVILCRVDRSLQLLLRDSGRTSSSSRAGAAEGGWSKVAAKAAVPARTLPPERVLGARSVFTILGSKARQEDGNSTRTNSSSSSSKKKKEVQQRNKKHEVEIPDSWEQAEDDNVGAREGEEIQAANGLRGTEAGVALQHGRDLDGLGEGSGGLVADTQT